MFMQSLSMVILTILVDHTGEELCNDGLYKTIPNLICSVFSLVLILEPQYNGC